MRRFLTGAAAWLVGTAVAGGLVWFGAGMVLKNAVASTSVPVVTVTPPISLSPSAAPVPSRTPAAAPSSAAAPAPSSPASSAASSAAAGTVRTYTLRGGHVTLLLTATSARLVTAIPDDGYSVQNWSAAGWLRVDFSSGANVSSLIAAWNGHAPSVTVTN